MSHNEERVEAWKEGVAAMISGITYGISSVLAGSPLDVVKTKMQIMHEYKAKGILQTTKTVYSKYGIKGFFKGASGPLIGSSIFRASQFASFEYFYTKTKDNKLLTKSIPFSAGLEYRVVIGGFIAGTCRAIIECPFEYTKVRRQTNQSWVKTHLYYGFRATWCKATGMLVTYFVIIDSFRRNTKAFESKFELFVLNGTCATLGNLFIWPFEIVKNKVQSHNIKHYSIISEIKSNVKNNGVAHGLFRGAGAGLGSVFIRNGVSMIVMQYCQKSLTKLGFRKQPNKS